MNASPTTFRSQHDPEVQYDNESSPYWYRENLPAVAAAPRLATEPSETWSPAIVKYLSDHGLTAEDAAASLGAKPCWLLDRYGRSAAMQHPRFGACGERALRWTLAHSRGVFSKFAAAGSGDAFSIAAPPGEPPLGIRDATAIIVAEGPYKAAAFAVATGRYAVAGHGVSFGELAWFSFVLLLCGLGLNKERSLRGRTFFVAGDEGDLAVGHALVRQAVGRTCQRILSLDGRVRVVRHPS